jgi:hypothetical protein
MHPVAVSICDLLCRPVVGAVLLAAALPGAPAAAADRYHATWRPASETVEVNACFDGEAPNRLARHQKAAAHTDWIRYRGRILPPGHGDHLQLPPLPDHACVSWRVRLGEAADAGNHRVARRSGGALLTASSLWFWSPAGDRRAEVTVRTDPGQAFSAPWPQREDGIWTPVQGPPWWSSRTVFGDFRTDQVTLHGGRLDVALAGEFNAAQRADMGRWLARAAESVSPVLGRFPRDRVQVIVVPSGPRNEPVPWAHVLRGGGPAVEFFVDLDRPLAEFDRDWTATHEFSHLLLPYVAWNDRWLSEGLASYYQNVLRARDGRLTEREAWQALHEGFARGRAATGDDTLAAAARSGWGATMRVYWAGAALALEADVRLRDASRGTVNLDTALRRFNDCCVKPGGTWRAADLLGELERRTGLGVFEDLRRRYPRMRGFPRLESVYGMLGLRPQGGQIRLLGDVPAGSLRREIMRPGARRDAATPTDQVAETSHALGTRGAALGGADSPAFSRARGVENPSAPGVDPRPTGAER